MSTIILPQRIWVGSYNAQKAIKNQTVSKDRKVTQFEIELPTENGGTSYIDGKTHAITTSLVICAKPGQIRHTRLPFKCYYIHMIVKDGLLRDMLAGLPNFIEMENTEHIRSIFKRICACRVAERAEDELLRQSLILELVYAVHRGTYTGKTPSKNKAVEKAVAYIKNNLTSDLTLEKLANEANFAPSYFHKLFKVSTGKTVHTYIEDLRIEQATNLLITTEKTLTEIAYACGFSSQSYFSYAFKRHTGMTPRAYTRTSMARYDKK